MSDKHEIAFVKFPSGFGENADVYVKYELIVSIFSRGDYYRVALEDGTLLSPISAESVAAMSLVVLTAGEAVVIASETTDYMGIEFRGVKNPEEFCKGLDEAQTGEGSEK